MRVLAIRALTPSRQLAGRHYGEEIARKYGCQVREWLLDYVCSGLVVAVVLTGVDAVRITRTLAGESPLPLPGTIRGDLSCDNRHLANAEHRADRNLIHTADSLEAARREIRLWFGALT